MVKISFLIIKLVKGRFCSYTSPELKHTQYCYLMQFFLLPGPRTKAHAMVASEPYDSFSHQVYLFPAFDPVYLVATKHQWSGHLLGRQAWNSFRQQGKKRDVISNLVVEAS